MSVLYLLIMCSCGTMSACLRMINVLI